MPVSPEDATTKDVQYPDDLRGDKWTILDYLYWDAAEESDAEELPDDAQYGLWMPVKKAGTDAETWASCPAALREELEERGVEEGDTFEVLEIEKGPRDHDPYAVDLRILEDGDAI